METSIEDLQRQLREKIEQAAVQQAEEKRLLIEQEKKTQELEIRKRIDRENEHREAEERRLAKKKNNEQADAEKARKEREIRIAKEYEQNSIDESAKEKERLLKLLQLQAQTVEHSLELNKTASVVSATQEESYPENSEHPGDAIVETGGAHSSADMSDHLKRLLRH